MNKERKAIILSPLILVPLSLIGAILIHGSAPDITNELIELILFISIVSLPVGYLALILIVLPTKWVLQRTNYLSAFTLTSLGGLYGGLLFTTLDYFFIPGHDTYELLSFMFVFFMGFFLGVSTTLSYAIMAGITHMSRNSVNRH